VEDNLTDFVEDNLTDFVVDMVCRYVVEIKKYTKLPLVWAKAQEVQKYN